MICDSMALFTYRQTSCFLGRMMTSILEEPKPYGKIGVTAYVGNDYHAGLLGIWSDGKNGSQMFFASKKYEACLRRRFLSTRERFHVLR